MKSFVVRKKMFLGVLFGVILIQLFALPDEVAEDGRQAVLMLERVSCGGSLLEAMDSCVVLEDGKNAHLLRAAALKVTECYVRGSGRKMVDCAALSPVECTGNMSSNEFQVYTYFFTHLPAICLLHHEHHFHSETQRLIAELRSALKLTVENMEQVGRLQEEMYASMRDAKASTEDLIRNASEETDKIIDGHARISEMIGRIQRRFLAFDELSDLAGSLRDKVLLCVALLALVVLCPAPILVVYGLAAAVTALPMSKATFLLGTLKLLVAHPRFSWGARKQKISGRARRSYTIQTSTSKIVP
ncbi:hypothetical protein NDN08_002035 [Rhodosorus marinus]|uniref:Uncharacterized protein n=1 Tax=Rhodosorus marinus TaxID=101924 RepID=A0AAV8UWR5_9RHOD|nr:hypothetical protein NDN08_002035 [Rhodosorus marinus]